MRLGNWFKKIHCMFSGPSDEYLILCDEIKRHRDEVDQKIEHFCMVINKKIVLLDSVEENKAKSFKKISEKKPPAKTAKRISK